MELSDYIHNFFYLQPIHTTSRQILYEKNHCIVHSVFESVFYSKEQPEEHVLMMIMMMMLRTIIIMYLFLFSSLRAARRACIADGSCPEFTGFNPDLHAEPTQCVDGIANGYPCRNINLSSFRNFVDLGSVR